MQKPARTKNLANQHTAKVMDKKGSIEKNKHLEDLPPFDDSGLPDLTEFDLETTDTPPTGVRERQDETY